MTKYVLATKDNHQFARKVHTDQRSFFDGTKDLNLATRFATQSAAEKALKEYRYIGTDPYQTKDNCNWEVKRVQLVQVPETVYHTEVILEEVLNKMLFDSREN
jgi:hypothetical protein